MGFLKTFWGWLRKGVGLILPFFARARDFPGLGAAVRWTIHVVLLALILVGLYFVGRATGLRRHLEHGPSALRPFWLPIFFLLVYAMAWLGWLLWKLLMPEEETSAFPDIDEAWEEALT